MIIWVDEDEHSTYLGGLHFKHLGYGFENIGDATEGYRRILQAKKDDFRLAIIDVMLLPGSDLERFCPTKTHNGLAPGITLVNELIKFDPNYEWNKRVIFFSRTKNKKIIASIEACKNDHKIGYIRKEVSMTAQQFIAELQSLKLIRED